MQLIPVRGMSEIHPGDALDALLAQALARNNQTLEHHDVVVVTHKIVAKAEGAIVDLRTIDPSPFARDYAARWGKDPRQIEVILRQSARIVRMDHGVLITETRHGLICANAGVDASNVADDETVCVLPEDPDRSAAHIAEGIAQQGIEAAVIISDTFGRAWREGLTNVAIGVAGMNAMRDYVGMHDPQGRELRVSTMAAADELASAAELVMGKLDRVPVAIIRGYHYEPAPGSARDLLRRPELDLFR